MYLDVTQNKAPGRKDPYRQFGEVTVYDKYAEVAAVRLELQKGGKIVAYLYPAGDNYYEQEPQIVVLKKADK